MNFIYKIKYFIMKQYYTLMKIFSRIASMYLWLYSAFFDTTEEFERKYSKFSSSRYKKRKQQRSSSFYTNFDTKSQYNTSYKKIATPEKIISNNSFTNDPKYNQFFLDFDYEVLGVHNNADFKKVVRPAYIKLINKYHQDKVPVSSNMIHRDLYAEISKRINLAYDNLKREHKH